MIIDPWLPLGTTLADAAVIGRAIAEGLSWQLVATRGEGRALLVRPALARRWIDAGLLAEGALQSLDFGEENLLSLSSPPSQALCCLSEAQGPRNVADAMAFALAYRQTRRCEREANLAHAIYVEKLGILLPDHGDAMQVPDDMLLGYWLSRGSWVSLRAFRDLHRLLNWMSIDQLRGVVEAAGFTVNEILPASQTGLRPLEPGNDVSTPLERRPMAEKFALPGRPVLEAFFHEHVIDIILNRERYKAFGTHFPGAVVLHGPPGCGKTYAVEQLVTFLGWPSFQIDAASVGSPYIHETSRKVAEVFDRAIQNAPSVLVMDEMEAFLADRENNNGHHRVEEVAEFLRRIPEAVKKDVLLIAMTNRIDMIDSAILRRGRFDHVIEVNMPDEDEVRELLRTLLAPLPGGAEIDVEPYVMPLAGRPLSDAAFVAREGARLSARAGHDTLDPASLDAALERAVPRDEETSGRRIGFV